MKAHFHPVLLETLVLLVLGITLALLANQLSPRGLSLSRDYFARAKSATLPETVQRPSPATNAIVAASNDNSELKHRLEQKGLSLIEGDAVEKLFQDPQYEQELIVFVDARDDHHYQEGHIPGAFQLDRYYPEKYLPAVLPACLSAIRIVVYCTGGKCEDSEFAALSLIDASIPAANISVYAGGISDWVAQKRPVEVGQRKSGVLK